MKTRITSTGSEPEVPQPQGSLRATVTGVQEVGRDEKTADLARHFARSPKFTVAGALAIVQAALKKAGR